MPATIPANVDFVGLSLKGPVNMPLSIQKSPAHEKRILSPQIMGGGQSISAFI